MPPLQAWRCTWPLSLQTEKVRAKQSGPASIRLPWHVWSQAFWWWWWWCCHTHILHALLHGSVCVSRDLSEHSLSVCSDPRPGPASPGPNHRAANRRELIVAQLPETLPFNSLPGFTHSLSTDQTKIADKARTIWAKRMCVKWNLNVKTFQKLETDTFRI